MGARVGRRQRNGQLLQAVHMDQPHGADAALPDILESEPDLRLLDWKVSTQSSYLHLRILSVINIPKRLTFYLRELESFRRQTCLGLCYVNIEKCLSCLIIATIIHL